MLTTEPSGAKHIREEIVALIRDATRYVYAENFQFCDPAIVRAACQSLRNRKALFVCVVVPDPVCDPSKANTYLNRIAYAKMGFAACDEGAIIHHGDGKTSPAGGVALVESTWLNPWLQKDKLAGRDLGIALEEISISSRRRAPRAGSSSTPPCATGPPAPATKRA